MKSLSWLGRLFYLYVLLHCLFHIFIFATAVIYSIMYTHQPPLTCPHLHYLSHSLRIYQVMLPHVFTPSTGILFHQFSSPLHSHLLVNPVMHLHVHPLISPHLSIPLLPIPSLLHPVMLRNSLQKHVDSWRIHGLTKTAILSTKRLLSCATLWYDEPMNH